MSDDSLESVVEDAVSEPVQDIKEDAVEVEEKVEAEADAEPETKDVVEEKKLSKADKVQAKLDSTKEAMQKRINRITASNKAEIERRVALEAQVKELTPAVVDDAPKEQDFDSYEEFDKARLDHRVKKEVESSQLAEKQAQLDEANRVSHAKAEKAFQEKEHIFRTENPSYVENSKVFIEQANLLVAQKGAGNPTIEAINGWLIESDLAPNLINELGSKPDFVEELADMTPNMARRELWKLESSYGTASQENKPLPKPIKGVKGKGSPTKRLEDESPEKLMSRLGL